MKPVHWPAKVLTCLLLLFLAFDGVMKLLQPSPVRVASAKMGFSPAGTALLGFICLGAAALFAVSRTSVLGAIVLTGYLGGAIACQILTHAAPLSILFPLIFAALVWLSWLFRGAILCFPHAGQAR